MTDEMKLAAVILLVALFSYFNMSLNGKKNRRIRQFPFVFFSVVVMIVGIGVWKNHYDYAAEICKSEPWLKNAEIVVINLSLIIGELILKLIYRPLSNLFFRDNRKIEYCSLGIYSLDEEYVEWFLKNQWKNYRPFFLTMVIAVTAVCAVFMGLTWKNGPESQVWALIYVGAVIVILDEIYGYLNGQTKEEYEHSVLGDEADARHVSNFYKIREILEKLLPEPILSAHTGCEFANRETPADIIKKLSESEDFCDRITADYFDSAGRYKTADVDCVQATVQLMRRKNVIFTNPFYRDLSMYVLLPVVNALMSGKKCLVLCGRKASAEDVEAWIFGILQEYSHMESLWRVGTLSDKIPEVEVGILTFTQVYDKRVLSTNAEFLRETDFVLLVEPSAIINTSQIALSIISEEMKYDNREPVYCIIDRNVDGLVDTMSHILHTEITDVVAMPVPKCNYSAMSWDADGDFCRQQLFDKQTKYLGNGIELASVAVKNQVPKVTWYSETKVPIKDIRWLAGQNYATLCRYMNLPSQQKSLYEKIDFVSNLWSGTRQKEQFVIAEDEVCNMFSTMRAYLSRGKDQAFVNVLSENYLLRDYMRCNRQMFMTNPNAIPSLVTDYAKTERNTVLKLIIMMNLRSVSEDEVIKEFRLAGIKTDSPFETLVKLTRKYTFADESLFTVHGGRKTVNGFITAPSCTFSIADEEFEKYFSDSLKNAYYILEDEKNEEDYIEAKLFGHVTQNILPGQFVTYAGKYYYAKLISPQSGVILRRASDLFDSRKYYRQIRKYVFDSASEPELVSAKTVMDIEFAEIRSDFQVFSTGYLELTDNKDLHGARVVDLSADPCVGLLGRKYRNKSVLRIKLPETNDKVLFTFCLLLSEIFRSVFPDGWQYLAAVTKRPDNIDGMLNYLVYDMDGLDDDGYIYIIEDSDIDLGLVDAVGKNFMKLMEILADFLDWHYEKMHESASKDPAPARVAVEEEKESKRRSLVLKLLDRIRRLFGTKKEEVKVDEPDETPEPQQTSSEKEVEPDIPEYDLDMSDDAPKAINIAAADDGDHAEAYTENEKPEGAAGFTAAEYHPEDELEPEKAEDPDLVHIDGTDIFDNEGLPEDNEYFEMNFAAMGLTPIEKSRYQRECFLKFGFDEIDGRIQTDELRKYLRVRGWSNNSLTMARKREVFEKKRIDADAVNHCDFCGLPLTGVSYDQLNDGRIRCNDCSASAVTNVDEFRDIFFRSLSLMRDFYEVTFRVPVNVKMVDARTIAKNTGCLFVPSCGMTARVLGYAQKKNGKYSVLMENGSPRLATIDTMVHELTHIWQYLNWDDARVVGIYGMGSLACTAKARDIVYEGMAMWSAIQFLYQIGETYYASQQELMAELRYDVYGAGFRLYKKQYPLVKDSSIIKYSPFKCFPTLEPEDVRNAVRSMCTEENCVC